jgi:hypothetical protein
MAMVVRVGGISKDLSIGIENDADIDAILASAVAGSGSLVA